MEKLKVVHIYKSFDIYNGLIEILLIMMQNINREQFDLAVCVNEYSKNSFGEKFKKMGGKIYSLNIKQKIYNEPYAFFKLCRFLKNYKPQIVQTHVLKANLFGTLAAKMARVPVVIATEMTLKDIAPTKLKRFRDQIAHPLTGYLIGKCDRFIVTSEYIKNEWTETKSTNKKVEIIYPPFNMEKYKQANNKKQERKHDSEIVTGYVGRLSEEKSVKNLIKAICILNDKCKDIKLKIAGSGSQENYLKEFCREKGIDDKIIFEGYKENSFEFLKQIDIFVLPSRTEGCPIVILEAMAMGLPIIATNVGGNTELIVNNETGVLVPHENPEALADSILFMIENPKKAREMGLKAKVRAFTEFSPEKFTETHQELYKKLYSQKVYASE